MGIITVLGTGLFSIKLLCIFIPKLDVMTAMQDKNLIIVNTATFESVWKPQIPMGTSSMSFETVDVGFAVLGIPEERLTKGSWLCILLLGDIVSLIVPQANSLACVRVFFKCLLYLM